ncbi:DUF4276 family protein [Corynebacterium aurimucosum]|nr:DUF4276 family protein [Corynebacterium aurimucosum]
MAEPYIYAQLLREGSSDDGLQSILEATLIDVGCNVNSTVEIAPYPSGDKTVLGGLKNLLDQVQPHVVFVHRDADNAGVDDRISEITRAAKLATAKVGNSDTNEVSIIPVIPVKETESWILWALHDPNFRSTIAGMDSPTLVPYKNIEQCSAKERLYEIHQEWAEQRGGKRNRRDRFERDRSTWLENITTISYLRGCPSFETLYEECEKLVRTL